MLYRTLSAPISVQIELTTKCSNNCPHCYNYQRQDDDPDTTMSTEELRITLEALGRANVFSVTITGGEPLLQPDLVVEAIGLCKKEGIVCSLNSNLTVLTEKTVARMKEAGPFKVLTSIASYDESVHDTMMGRKGALGRTLRGIEMLKKQGIWIGANMVITQQNANQVYETGLFAHKLGVRMFSATKASPPLGCPDYSAIQPTQDQIRCSLDELLRIHEETGVSIDALEPYPLCFLGDIEKYERFAKRRCSAGVMSATIGADGQVRPCSHSNKMYGSIFDEDIATIYSRMEEWRTGELVPEKCLACKYFGNCSGGCRCEAEYHGDIRGMDPCALCPADVVPKPKKIVPRLALEPESTISINPDIRFRKEDFGYVLWMENNVVFVGNKAGELLLRLRTIEATLDDAVSMSGSDTEKVSAVLADLKRKKMVNFKSVALSG
ncbi:MAG TPA: radical SAM protein [Candidatus Saccharimonadales bacterium]|jgi:radical SAM protein with 4Fe4S-binding SPASM domain|nr:radical SAM protein [Candidatus Saccharimonadales bacterium]